MPSKNFLFVFVRDRTYRPPSTYVLEYVRFRYPGVEAHKVLSVEDAHKFMLKALGSHDSIGEVHLSAHSSSLGYVWGRLRAADPFRSVAHPDVLVYSRTNPIARKVAARGNTSTSVAVHGCNLGKTPEALTRWRDLFGGAKGTGIAPTLFQHYALPRFVPRATWKGKVFYKQEVNSTAGITEYVAKAAERLKYQLSKREAVSWKKESERKRVIAELTAAANRDLDQWLTRHYRLYLASNELQAHRRGLSQTQAVAFMRDLFDEHHGIPTSFLYKELDESLWLREEKLRATMKPKGAVFPEDRAWATSHKTIRAP